MANNRLILLLLTIILLTSYVFALDVTSVLNDGQGDFDPWNQTRWAAWYSGGKIVQTFDIGTDVQFAARTGDWQPDITALTSGRLFYINSGQGLVIDGNHIVIDVRAAAYRDRTLSQVYSGGSSELSATTTFDHCFRFAQALNSSITDVTLIRNFTLRGFVQSIRAWSSQEHPLVIENCTFNRNQWGVYLSGKNTVVTANQFLENGKGAMYSGALSSENVITYNTYRDNCYVPSVSYADIVMDTASKTRIENNQFIASLYPSTHFSAAVSFYRNLGEGNNLREGTPHLNVIRYNSITDRQIGIHMGARMGRTESEDYDIAQEGRDYGYYNAIQFNDFNDVTVGIKLNTSGNTIESNVFQNVDKPIVLNCVFYSLTENTINNQNASDVYFWMKYSDYTSYAWLFPYQWERNRGIDESEKLVHIRSDYGSGGFNYSGPATLIESPTLMVGADAVVADFDGDKKVNLRDFAALAEYWQRVSDIPLPVMEGLVLHLDTSDIAVTDVGGVTYVTRWNDQSGSNNHAVQPDSGLQPILDGSGVLFDGINDYLDIAASASFDTHAVTIFAVYAVSAFEGGNGTARIINLGYNDIDPGTAVTKNTSAYAMVVGGLTNGVRAFSKTSAGSSIIVNSLAPADYAANTYYVGVMTVTSTSGGNTAASLFDGEEIYSANSIGATAECSGNLLARIGAGVSGTSVTTPAYYLNGRLSAVLVYDHLLTEEEIESVRGYLNRKYVDPKGGFDPDFYNFERFIERDASGCSIDLAGFIACWLDEIEMDDTYSAGGTPIDIAVGDFYEALPGDECAVIWSAPVSEISDSSTVSNLYYSIIIYDSNGIEINRSGRSPNKWAAIAAGDFLSAAGDEIAAVPENAINGYYPVCIFRRGYMNPAVTLLTTNINKIRDITAGNFYPAIDAYDEVGVTYEPGGPMEIHYAKPTDTAWSAATTGLAGRPLQIAGGHFYNTAADSIAMITANAIGGCYRIYFYLPGASTSFAIAQANNTEPFTAIAGGRFDAARSFDQVAAAGGVVDGVCRIGYYSGYQDGAYRFADQDVVGVVVSALQGGSLAMASMPGYYERIEGIDGKLPDYGALVRGWGVQTAVLPQVSQGHSIPLFWIGQNPQSVQQKYLKVTPLIR